NRYVWDTVNIFTWEGGSAVLRKGDFNGDGVTDYADLKGNIYKGNANRFPELTKANIVFLPIVADMNNDGLDDMLAYTARGNLILYLGHKILDSIPTTRIEVPMPFDTTHTGFAGVFTRANGGVRFVFTRRLPAGSPTADPYYTMYSVEWAANKPVFTQIDQVLSGKEAAYDVCRLQPVLGKNYFIFREGLNTPSISIYDLSNDKLEKLITKKMDAVSILATLNHSIDGDSAKDFIIMERQSDGLDRVFYSGANPSELRPIGKYKALNHGTTLNIVSTDDATGDGIPDVIVPWATPDYWRWSFLYGPGSLTSVNSVTVSDAANTVLGISQDPVQPDLLRVGIDVEKDGIYEFSIINIRGSVLLKRDMQLSSGKQQILLDVS
ncbi:MAG: hypothetical protein JNL32_16535, partial [Candidatus Kapabacteria bacterium]|nr:hypothetical protein [Candidatus Kapabacteria bacterium]